MKKTWLGMFTLLIVLSIFLLTPDQVFAGETPIDQVHIEVDTPVDGVSLKSEAIVYEYIDSRNMEMKKPNTASKVVGVSWYKTTEPSKPLSSGYKAKLGESYIVSVVLEAKDGYTFIDDLYKKNNLVNGGSADVYSASTEDGTAMWLFEGTLATIPAASGKPVVTIKDINLTPYEGNPMEVTVSVSNATNVKYQWQYVYDTGVFSDELDLEDNNRYNGTKTPHFQLRSYFGDNWDEELNFGNIRCKITSDNGTVYTQEMWYTLLDREELSGFTFTGLETPKFGKVPDYSVVSADSSKYNATKVLWYGPQAEDGTYPQMGVRSTFKAGNYQCKILVTTEDAYKINTSSGAFINGQTFTIETHLGTNKAVWGPDTYSVTLPFEVPKAVISQMNATVTEPKTGNQPTNAVSATTGLTAAETEWSRLDDRGRLVALKEGEPFQPGTFYQCTVCMSLEEGYEFAAILNAAINEKKASLLPLLDNNCRYIYYRFKTENEELNQSANVTELFDDVYNTWYTSYIQYVYDQGLMTGIKGTTLFKPDTQISKAEVAQVLYNMEGKPIVTDHSVFTSLLDVSETAWYADAVAWAYSKGIVTGDLYEKKFSPNTEVNREQLALMVYRYAKFKGYETTQASTFEGLVGAEQISSWALDGMKWAVGSGLISGIEADGIKYISPQKSASRAQVAAILQRFYESYK